MFTLTVTHKDGRKEILGTFDDFNETYDRYIKGNNYKGGEGVNNVSKNVVGRYY